MSEGHFTKGEPGELHISGDAMIERYLDGENSGSFYKEDGDSWLVTGDIAVLDKDDFVYVLSRSKDIIKKGGTPLTPACLEATIMEHLKIQVSQRNDIFGSQLSLADPSDRPSVC